MRYHRFFFRFFDLLVADLLFLKFTFWISSYFFLLYLFEKDTLENNEMKEIFSISARAII